MKTLKIQLTGLLGAWSTASKSEWRLTKDPKPSHVLGLLACCMGLGRDDDWGDLKYLTIAVHSPHACVGAVRPETMRDYHTVKEAITNDGKPGRSVITQREYIVNPSYTVDITGDDEIVDAVANAVRHPVWQPYLGRRCCVPSAPLLMVTPQRQDQLHDQGQLEIDFGMG